MRLLEKTDETDNKMGEKEPKNIKRRAVRQNVIADDLRDIMFAGHAILDEMRAAPKK